MFLLVVEQKQNKIKMIIWGKQIKYVLAGSKNWEKNHIIRLWEKFLKKL